MMSWLFSRVMIGLRHSGQITSREKPAEGHDGHEGSRCYITKRVGWPSQDEWLLTFLDVLMGLETINSLN